ncbi:MAG: hypothetical protein AAGF01_16705 [Cyanobacteria bacterium P01_G01_bin.38]
MLKTLTLSDFSSLIGSLFQVQDLAEANLQLELIEAVKSGNRTANPANRPEAFSLLFKGPSNLALAQRLYCLRHSQLGELGIFLVPVACHADGMQYEAVFD